MEEAWDIRHKNYRLLGRLNIDWLIIEEQALEWSNLLRKGKVKGKKLRFDSSMNYLADGNDPIREGDKRGAGHSCAPKQIILVAG